MDATSLPEQERVAAKERESGASTKNKRAPEAASENHRPVDGKHNTLMRCQPLSPNLARSFVGNQRLLLLFYTAS